MEMEKYDSFHMIGAGSYGTVYSAREIATNRIVAVKIIKKKPNPTERERKDQKKFLKECNIHSSLSHPNIIQMLGSFETIEEIVVVTELAGADLHRFMSQNKLTEKHIQKLCWNLLSALYYLHSNRVSHRDLKPQNILLNNSHNIDEIEAKLCDFGLARKMKAETYVLTSVKGTPVYMAPEVIDEAIYDERADLWSVGCILYEAHFGRPPIKTKSFAHLIRWLRNPDIEWHSPISDVPKSFLVGLLKKEPEKRLTWPQILDHKYVGKDNLIILDNNKTERPLTEDLTTSQLIRKEKQRDEIIFNRGQKMIAEAMNKCHGKNNHKIAEAGPHQKRKQSNVIGDNESISSDDSVNAIIQTDLETDVEGPLIKKQIKPPIETKPADQPENQNLIIQRYTDNFAAIDEAVGGGGEKDNANLNVNTLMENMEKMQLEDENKWLVAKGEPLPSVAPKMADDNDNNFNNLEPAPSSVVPKSNTELVRRKLSQNLDNFSIRLGNNLIDKKCEKNNKDSSKEKSECGVAELIAEKSMSGNSDDKQDTYEDDQGPPIENEPIVNEEWLAFIHMSMQEVLNGETDSLKHQNLIGVIVAILRNFNASCTLISSVVQLLSIPFVLPISSGDIGEIKTVYLQTKLLPNLIFASKIVCVVKSSNPSFSSTLSSSNFAALGTTQEQEQVVFKRMCDLSVEQLKTLKSIYELVCYLIHLNDNFLAQFCDSVYIIANDLLRNLLSDVVYDAQGMQIVSAIVSILCLVLRETPENAELVETIIFHESVDIIGLLQNGHHLLRSRLCKLLKIIARFSCSALQKSWTTEFKQTLESLLDESNTQVKEAAKDAIDELSHLSFYNI